MSGPRPGLQRANPRLKPSEIGMADSRAAAAPTGETTSPSLSGGWKPMTLISSRSHPGRSLSGNPVFDPFRSLRCGPSSHHLVAGPTTHGRYHGCVSLIRPELQKAKSRKIVHPVRALRSIQFSHPVTLTSLIPNVVSPRRGRNQREPMAMINAMNDRGRENAGIARPPTGSRDDGPAPPRRRGS